MSLPNFYVSFDVAGGPWEPTTEMISLAITAGRQNALDTYGATTVELVFRRTSANTADLDLLVPGTPVELGAFVAGNLLGLEITDVINQFSIAPNADLCVVTMEGSLARANRSWLNNYNLSADTLTLQCDDLTTESGITISGLSDSDPQMDGTTVTSVADWLQKAATTVNGRIDDTNEISLYDRFYYFAFGEASSGDPFVFSDGTVATPSGSIRLDYQDIVFNSLAENYYTRAIVDPDNHAAQTSTAAGATAPYRVLQLNTFNSSTGQAQDYADFLVSTYSDPTHKRVASVTVNGATITASYFLNNFAQQCISATVPIIFRGTTYNAVIEGWAITMTPGESLYTFYFSGADLNNYLILDDPDRGKLDENRLGY